MADRARKGTGKTRPTRKSRARTDVTKSVREFLRANAHRTYLDVYWCDVREAFYRVPRDRRVEGQACRECGEGLADSRGKWVLLTSAEQDFAVELYIGVRKGLRRADRAELQFVERLDRRKSRGLDVDGKKFRLEIGLVPRPLHHKNLRNMIPRQVWEAIRSERLEAAGGRCEICGSEGKSALAVKVPVPEFLRGKTLRETPSGSSPLDCDEVWAYDDARCVATLRKVRMLCKLCHSVKHIARGAEADRRALVAHFMAVNQVGREVFEEHEQQAYLELEMRSAKAWRVDLGPYASLVGEQAEVVAEAGRALPEKGSQR